MTEPKVLTKAWWIFGFAALFYCYEYLLRITPSVMAEDLMQYYRIGAASLGNLAAFYYYAYTPMQFPVGVLMDRFNPRYLITLACLCCAVGSWLFAGIEKSFLLAGVGRFLVGFGSAFAFVGVLKLATLWLPANRFALVSGIATALGMLGAMFGEISLAYVLNYQDWRTTTHYLAWFGVILAGVLYAFVRYPKRLPTGEKSSEAPTVSTPELIQGFISIIKKPTIWLIGMTGAILFLSLSVFAETWGILFLKQAHALSAQQASVAVSMVFLGWAIGSPLVGWFADYFQKPVFMLSMGSVFACGSIASVLYIPNLSLLSIKLILFLYGVSCSTQVLVFLLARHEVDDQLAGTALATTNMFVMLSGVLFIPVVGYVLDWIGPDQMINNVPFYSKQSYQMALTFLPFSCLLGLAFSSALFFKRRNKVTAQ